MKSLTLLTVLGAVIVTSPVFALSTDDGSSHTTSYGAPIADPDEQKPRFMVTPSNRDQAGQSVAFGAPGTTMPSMQNRDAGSSAFERAFTHQNTDR